MTVHILLERDLIIVNRRGLHARASAKLVKLVETFAADVQVSKDGQTVGGTSIMGLMMLAASPGCSIKVCVSGNEAEAAIEAISELVENGFGETD
ncbi:PTS-dependent dihydroxyacetone kinase, phosphotransferase subunit DhaM [Roseibium album]|jgi:phosphocarrier protein HPr|nr:PTS-dependent dihydroxyacetone kinase, phosphotransferase subunit DhaM [Roseibium album]